MQHRTASCWLIICLISLTFVAGGAVAQVLQPARAVYDLTLNRDQESPGIDAATGRLVVEYVEHCSGFIFNQGFLSRFTSSEGPSLNGNMQASVWESRDGRVIRFNLLSQINGKVVDREQGRADLGPQGAGNAVWELPEP